MCKLQGVLNGDDPVVQRKELNEGIEQGGRAGTGASRDKDVLSTEQGLADQLNLAGRKRSQRASMIGTASEPNWPS